MKTRTIMMTALGLMLAIMGCENSKSDLEVLGSTATIAEEEIFALKSAASAECDVDAVRFNAHLYHGGMLDGDHQMFFGWHFPRCATVTVNGDDFPKEIVIDYGEGCTGWGGMDKSGVITITISDTLTNPDATYTITYEDVTFGRRTINKSMTIKNEGQNTAGHWVISSTTEMSTAWTTDDGEELVIVRNYEEQREWINGFETRYIDDDEFLRTGGGSITVNDELRFERTIIDPLHINRSCMFPLSGVIQITRNGETMVIDFGDGTCDNIATVTKGDETEEIELISGRFRKGFDRFHRNMHRKHGWW